MLLASLQEMFDVRGKSTIVTGGAITGIVVTKPGYGFSGTVTVTITGDGLAPHLEAFMWEVLRAVQVRVNEDGLDMLLGAPS